jgi:hypothetical protein
MASQWSSMCLMEQSFTERRSRNVKPRAMVQESRFANQILVTRARECSDILRILQTGFTHSFQETLLPCIGRHRDRGSLECGQEGTGVSVIRASRESISDDIVFARDVLQLEVVLRQKVEPASLTRVEIRRFLGEHELCRSVVSFHQNSKWGAQEQVAPCAQSMHDREQLFVMVLVVELCTLELAGLERNDALVSPGALNQRGTQPNVTGVTVDQERLGEVRSREQRSRTENVLESLEGSAVLSRPDPWGRTQKAIEGSSNASVVTDEATVVVG